MRYMLVALTVCWLLLGGSVVAQNNAARVAAEAVTGAADQCTGLIDPDCTLQQNLQHIYPIAVRIIALLAFLAVIYAGYLYITSFGQSSRIDEAKAWLLAAVTGIILIILVPVIVSTIESLPVPGRSTNTTPGGATSTPSSSQPSIAPDQQVPGTPEQLPS